MSEYSSIQAIPKSSIRNRLVGAFMLIVLLPMAMIGLVIFLSSIQSSREQSLTQLNTVVDSKEQKIINWVNQLELETAILFAGSSDLDLIAEALENASVSTAGIKEAQTTLQPLLLQRQENQELFDEISVVSAQGLVIASSNGDSVGKNFFILGKIERNLRELHVNTAVFNPDQGALELIITNPIVQNGASIGLIATRADPNTINTILSTGAGETGNAYLIGSDFSLLTPSSGGVMGDRIDTAGARAALLGQTSMTHAYPNASGEEVLGVYRRLPDLQAAILVEDTLEAATKYNYVNLAVNVSVALSSLIIAVFSSLLITRGIADPITNLSETASRIAAGESELVAEKTSDDEIGLLADSLNHMKDQMNGLIAGLEQRVQDRTRDLEKQTKYLQATSEVSQAIGSMLEFDLLAQQMVNLIRTNFGLYYVGLFLTSDDERWAVLKAGTGDAGHRMIERGHKIQVGSGMIGWAIANNKARVALEAGQDAVRLATAELPNTRSEAALPLHSRGRVIGALSVQSDQVSAFNEMTIAVMQSMADHAATALDNARLFTESRQALEATRRAYGETTRQAWEDLIRRRTLSYTADEMGVHEADTGKDGLSWQETTDDPQILRMAIVVRGQELGTIEAHKPEEKGHWTKDETALMENLVEQLSVALDNARLYSETQQRAERERLISEITSKVRASTDTDVILQTSITELATALRIPQGRILIRGAGSEKASGQGGALNE